LQGIDVTLRNAAPPAVLTMVERADTMNRLTLEERRRMFLARQEAGRQTLVQTFQPMAVTESSATPWLTQALGTGMIVALLGGGLIAWQALAFHVPTSIIEALLPRL
jgi:hypothetical protein